MRNRVHVLSLLVVGLAVSLVGTNQIVSAQGLGSGFAAVPGQRGGQDMFGPYDVDPNWPQDLADLPGHEAFTYGAGQGVFAENPDRIYILHRGELPNIDRPAAMVSDVGPALSFPVFQVPWRNASVGPRASLPGSLDGDDTDRGEYGVDHNWEHCLVVVDGDGNIIEEWTQWDSLFRRPHFVTMNPYCLLYTSPRPRHRQK